MILDIDTRSAVPIYAQIVDQVRVLAGRGVLAAGERLPSVRDLAVRLRVNRNTVARAYRELEAEGTLETRHGQGTFVGAADDLSGERIRERLAAEVDRMVAEARRLGVGTEELVALIRQRMQDHEAAGRQRPAEVDA